MRIIRNRAYARVGVIGNPSDGYGGRTIAMTLGNYFAEVVLYPWERVEIIWSEQDKSRFDSIEELVRDVELNGYYGGVRLIKATIKRFADHYRRMGVTLSRENFSIRYYTNIPRGVGLSGSSAIVVATIRCLLDFYNLQLPLPIQASLARSVENDELQIACGFQDRVAQVYQGLVCMDFGRMKIEQGLQYGSYEPLRAEKLPELYVAYDTSASKTSDSVHGPLRNRLHDDASLRRTMDEIASLVPPARSAIEAGDTATLHTLIDRNFDLRKSLYNIEPAHQEMIDAARQLGASAKFAGSGGAILGTVADEEQRQQLEATFLQRNPHWRVILPQYVPPTQIG